MKFLKILIVIFILFQKAPFAFSRDDLTIDSEVKILNNFEKKYMGTNYIESNPFLLSLSNNCRKAFSDALIGKEATGKPPVAVKELRSVRNACESIGEKATKAERHCATASNVDKCIMIIIGMEAHEAYGVSTCCSGILRD
jgi:hypothetical protein